MRTRPTRTVSLWLALVACGALASCSTEIDPRDDSDRFFSVWGALDATADTQWVRIAPVRAALPYDAAPFDADVALVDVQSGQRSPMRDSLRVALDGRRVHAYWTTADVAPGAAYRLEVRRSDGAETRATVRIPEAPAEIRLEDGLCTCPARVTVVGAERLVDVLAIYRDPQTGRVYRRSKLRSIDQPDDARFTADVYFGDDADALQADPFDVYRFQAELLVVAGTEAWPEGTALGFETALQPLDGGRVENGVGFLGGVVTRRLGFQPGVGACGPGVTPRPCRDPGLDR